MIIIALLLNILITGAMTIGFAMLWEEHKEDIYGLFAFLCLVISLFSVFCIGTLHV